MSFQDDLEKRIDQIREDRLQNSLEGLAPADAWAKLRDSVILPRLIDAKNALSRKSIPAAQQPKNGTGIVLVAGPLEGPGGQYLAFSFKESYVQVTSSENNDDNKLNEMWDLVDITDENVRSKVTGFIECIALFYFSPAAKPSAPRGRSRSSI